MPFANGEVGFPSFMKAGGRARKSASAPGESSRVQRREIRASWPRKPGHQSEHETGKDFPCPGGG